MQFGKSGGAVVDKVIYFHLASFLDVDHDGTVGTDISQFEVEHCGDLRASYSFPIQLGSSGFP